MENSESSSAPRAFLFLVNPGVHYDPYPDWRRWMPLIARGEAIDLEWNTGSRRQGMSPGDLALLVKVGQDPRGLIAHGRVTSEIYEGPHWNPDAARPVTGWVGLRFTSLIDLDDPLPLAVLKAMGPGIRWTPRMSGTEIPLEIAERVIAAVEEEV